MGNKLTQSQRDIVRICDALKSLLLEKNRAYGDSALNPVRIFSKASAAEQILVRLDDKISRITRGKWHLLGEDAILDMLGYLVLLKIAIEREAKGKTHG